AIAAAQPGARALAGSPCGGGSRAEPRPAGGCPAAQAGLSARLVLGRARRGGGGGPGGRRGRRGRRRRAVGASHRPGQLSGELLRSLGCLLLLGCSNGPSYLVVHVSGLSALSATSLHVDVTNQGASGHVQDIPVPSKDRFSFSLSFPAERSGKV